MNKKKIVSLLVITAVLLSTSIGVHVLAETGQAVVMGYDLVDSGGHMDYTINSKYDTYSLGAATTWNSYLGYTVIRKDSGSTIADCDVYDVTRSDVSWAGITGTPTSDVLPGFIQLNTFFMDTYSTTKMAMVIKHEFGHSLGCDENLCSDLNIMYPSVKSNINLTIHDKASVDLARKSW